MGLAELVLVIPNFVLALTMVALYGNSFMIIIIVIALAGWPSTARLVRGEFLSHRERAYVEASQSIGLKDREIIFGEILPNTMPPIIVNTSIGVARAILIEAGLSFLGAGDPNVVSWGYMLYNAFRFIHESWWMITIPGIALFITALSLNLIGDGLNDALNPRLKHV
jgi:peptide/nickel transport system permease protein